MAKFYGPVLSELQSVEQQLNRELSSPYPELQQLLRHGTQLGGKRLRPAMVLLFGHACGHLTPSHQIIATVVEMVHTATLIHDDVLDDANERRHVPTINAQWNAHTSILVGDYLFSQAYRLAATTHCTTACEKVGEAARRVCEGELRQVLHRDHISLDEMTYLSMLQAK
ncbi:polyprenyl synthetase family protein, partial [Rubripirellula sp.]|nr:polyprenyl synthetase family protein [Rubripirellula sp.]